LSSAQLSNGNMAYPVKDKTESHPAFNICLLIGSDVIAKEIQLKRLKQEFLSPQLQDFNLDKLYAKEIDLKDIQERFLAVPLKSQRRIIIIKGADYLSAEAQEFFLSYSKKPHKQLILILDYERYDYKDGFIKAITRYSKVIRFKETVNPDTFALSRQIELRKTDSALRILSQLLKNGEVPERILGGLRYAWEKSGREGDPARKKLKFLLNCDIEIKTGRLPPAFALEKLVVSLCGFA